MGTSVGPCSWATIRDEWDDVFRRAGAARADVDCMWWCTEVGCHAGDACMKLCAHTAERRAWCARRRAMGGDGEWGAGSDGGGVAEGERGRQEWASASAGFAGNGGGSTTSSGSAAFTAAVDALVAGDADAATNVLRFTVRELLAAYPAGADGRWKSVASGFNARFGTELLPSFFKDRARKPVEEWTFPAWGRGGPGRGGASRGGPVYYDDGELSDDEEYD